MPIDWQQADSVFRLLAAAYAALGEEVFRGRYGDIAVLYGRDATYDAIKSEWKKVAKLANCLLARQPEHRPNAGPARPRLEARPPRRPALNRKAASGGPISIKDDDDVDEFQADVLVHQSPFHVPITSSRKRRSRPATDATIRHDSGKVKQARVNLALSRGKDGIDVNSGQDATARKGKWWFAPNETGPLPEQRDLADADTRQKVANVPRTCPVAASCTEELGESQRRSNTLRPGNDTSGQSNNLASPFLSKHRSDALQSRNIDWSLRPPSAEAGPSQKFLPTINREQFAEYQQDAQHLDIIDLVSSDGDTMGRVDLQPSPVGEHLDKGKGKISQIPATTKVPIERWFVDFNNLVCYLCSRQFQIAADLREHEYTASHQQSFSDPSRVEKAKQRVVKKAKEESSFEMVDVVLEELHPDAPAESAQHQQPTIIRGADRYAVAPGPEVDDEEVMQVSGALVEDDLLVSRIAMAPVRRRQRRQAIPVPVVTKASDRKKRFGHDIHSSEQLARRLRETVFEPTAAVDVAVRTMRLAGLYPHSRMPELLAEPPPQWTSAPAPPVETVRLQRPNGLPKIWATDAEFMQFPAVAQSISLPAMPATLIALSATVTNLLTGEQIINHRLKLPIPPEDVECRLRAWKRAPWQVRKQFRNHYVRKCPLPIIEPLEFAERMLAGGLSKDDFIFSWHLGFTDYNVLHDFLSRSNLAHHLPSVQNLVRPIYAWRELLPGLPLGHGLQKLFELVDPNSALNYNHHFADVDTKKLGIMSWKLLSLKYRPRSTTA